MSGRGREDAAKEQANHAELESAIQLFDERDIPHGEIKDLDGLGIYVLAFRDPDNIQVELTAPK